MSQVQWHKLVLVWSEFFEEEVPQRSILGPTLFLLYINDLHDDVICNIAIYANDITLYSKFDQASDCGNN